MEFDKMILILWLITSAVVIAQENKLGFGLNDLSQNTDFHLPANISSIRDNIFSFFNGFSRLPNLIHPINPLRLKRSVENSHEKKHQEKHSVKNHTSHEARSTRSSASSNKKNPNNDHQLSVITRVTSCNYDNHPGSRCLSCRESITCFRNNRAVVRRCYFILRYCNRGRCSSTPGNKCYRTPTTTTSTTSSTSTTTSTTNTTFTSTSTSSSNTTSTTNSTSSTSTSTVTSTTTPSSSTSSASSTSSGTTSASSTSTGSSSSTTSSSTT